MNGKSNSIFLKQKTNQHGEYYVGKVNGDVWVNAYPTKDGGFKFAFNKDGSKERETIIGQEKTNDKGSYFLVKGEVGTFYANVGESQYGPYVRLRVAAEREGFANKGGSKGGSSSFKGKTFNKTYGKK